MKTVKRIIAVILLIVAALAVGYLVFTGSRLAAVTDVGDKPNEQAEARYGQDADF